MTRRRRKNPGDPISNTYVEDKGRRYRICRHGSIPIMVELKGKRFGRYLDIDGRRARQLIRLSEQVAT
jgi:hypothetical protein